MCNTVHDPRCSLGFAGSTACSCWKKARESKLASEIDSAIRESVEEEREACATIAFPKHATAVQTGAGSEADQYELRRSLAKKIRARSAKEGA
jgi:hypothetical protein